VAKALMALNGKPSYLAEQELSRRVTNECCVQVEGNWYSVPAAMVRQNVIVQIRDQVVLIRQGFRIVGRLTRQEANHRARQVITGHWVGLVPQRAVEAAHQTSAGVGWAMLPPRASRTYQALIRGIEPRRIRASLQVPGVNYASG
jgi:hypothetical protein